MPYNKKIKINLIKEYLISGKVQGVGYRYFVKQLVDNLGLEGFVENLKNGQVKVVVNLDYQEEKIANTQEKIITALKKGPISSKVTDITISTIKKNPPTIIKDSFYIKH